MNYSYEDLAKVGWIFFCFFSFSVWHLVLVSLQTKTADERGRGLWLLSRQEQECKNSEKGVGIVSEEPRLWKQLRKSPRNPPCGTGTGPVERHLFICFFKSFFLSQVHIHLFTLQEKKTTYRVVVRIQLGCCGW